MIVDSIQDIHASGAVDIAISTAFIVITMRELFGLIRWLVDRRTGDGAESQLRTELKKINRVLGEVDRRTQAIENQLGITSSKTESLESAKERLFEKTGSLEGRVATLEGRLSGGSASGL